MLVVVIVRRAFAQWTPLATSSLVEARVGGLDNLLVTATALASGAIEATDRMRDEVARQAEARAMAVRPSVVAPLVRPVGLASLAAAGAAMVIWSAFAARSTVTPTPDATPPAAPLQSVRATISPPTYLGLAQRTLDDPDALTMPAGSRLRLDVRAGATVVWLEEPDQAVRSVPATGNGVFSVEWTPATTAAVVLAAGETAGQATGSRLMHVSVVPDEAPRVRVTEPGRDLAVGAPSAIIEVVAEASDAERLAGLRVAYVKMSGSGESFAFDEGEAPVAIDRTSPQQWRGRARLSLAALKLEDGDSLVYRALARDSNPDADWVSSDAFTVDVGTRLEFAGAGFAVPDEDRRYAISQQMVIVKTERLLAERRQLGAEPWTERTRMLAVEQRMVRAEVVFLSGGEVQDEVEEAEHAHELQEGRLENAGRAEMLRAINEMSRAEARLNAGDANGALVFERAALAALQRAFDRRRYFLRTLGERSRIDPARRLTGDRSRAQSRTRTSPEDRADPTEAMRTLVGDLAVLVDTGDAASPALLARLASMGRAGDDWWPLASALTTASTAEARRDAARAAMARVALRAREQAGVAGPSLEVSELRGWWRDETARGRRP
jgi:hypothetical protein